MNEKIRDEIRGLVDAKGGLFTRLSDQVWDCPELCFQERQSCALHQKRLEEEGFRVTRGVAGMDTAVVGEYGSGRPVIAILGEFDALAELSQQADHFEKAPAVSGGPGHGCGHNLLGAGGLAAATAVKDYLQLHHLPGTVRYYGCPAEEGGSGKAYMVRDGLFDDVDIALAWHPGQFNYAWDGSGCLGTYFMKFHFSGTAAHAATAPHLGRSALDACELTNVGVNYLREHIIDAARVHYAYEDAGGTAANVVPARATLSYIVRAPFMDDVFDIAERVKRIAQGAAMMTDTQLEIEVEGGTSNLMGNQVICDRYEENLKAFLPVEFTPEELDYAARFRRSLENSNDSRLLAGLRHYFPQASGEQLQEMAAQPVLNFYYLDNGPHASTDVGDVSWTVPTCQLSVACVPTGTPFHTWQMTAVGKSGVAHKGMLTAAKALALTAVDFLLDPALVERAKARFAQDRQGRPYRSPLPEGARPVK